MNRQQRRTNRGQPYAAEPWWKWAGVPNIVGSARWTREQRRDMRRAVFPGIVATCVVALALLGVLFGVLWLFQR